MSQQDSPEATILRSWHTNSQAWSNAIAQGSIASRTRVTNQAIIDAVTARRPNRVLDVGCGEGWLCRALQQYNIATVGVDAVASLLTQARQQGPGDYRQAEYHQLSQVCNGENFSLAVCNFSLLGEASVSEALTALSELLPQHGELVIQTLHPFTSGGTQIYRDGWRQSSWDGFGTEFSDPPPWYFRTLDSWWQLLHSHGFQVAALQEPLHPETGLPVSIIFTARRV